MTKLNFLVSLTTNDNDYQQEQASSAEEAGRRLGVGIKIIDADNDSITQSQQLLKIIQSGAAPRPDAIIFEPVGATALPQVGRAAVAAGIGWVVLNRDVDYLSELRRAAKTPVFSITSDHQEIRRPFATRWVRSLHRGPIGEFGGAAADQRHAGDQARAS
jgi:ABC-type sugar transport system substrate-binding protein